MKFPAQPDGLTVDPRAEPDYQIDPDVLDYYVREVKRAMTDPAKLREWHLRLSADSTMYVAVHDELTYGEKVLLKEAARG